VSLDHTCAGFITMNPGYLGRAELPEGLKALFRPMTVMVPDLVLICENMMMAEGFVEAKVLASKFYGLYSLLGELLSKQMHYDWGLRAVKSVLVVAGSFKRAEPDLPEQHLLMRALRDFNTPKIVQQDEVVFMGLIGDLFPNVNPPRMVDLKLEAAVHEVTVKAALHSEKDFMLKVVQLDELLAIRHCVFVMGPPGAGKSTCWKMLANARGVIGKKTKYVDLDPKAVSTEELYGYITMATREWKDGLLSKIMRDLGQESNTSTKWILLDGDLDTNWIESMNSVMDDNKMLTLASNERIPLKENMRMLFEIRDLRFASPATVSRAGILFISADKGTQWRSLVESWVNKLEASEEMKDVFRGLFTKYCADTLLFVKKECKPLVKLEDMNLVTSLLRMLDCLLTEETLKKIAANREFAKVIETYFVYCAVWAFGCSFSEKDGEDYRAKFSEYWRAEYKTVRIPSRETVFDYWLDPEELKFEVWKQSPYFKTIDFDSKKHQMATITVPTPETCSVNFWMAMLVERHVPCMLVGYAGCGKTALVNGLLQGNDPTVRISTTINFNFYTNAQALQVTLEAPLEKKTGSTFGPPGKASLVFFLDDLNLPEVDKYDTQSAIALVRQHIDYGHWYDRAKLTGKTIQNCQYLACMNPSAGSFEVNPRLQRHFVTFGIGFPGPTSLHTIYNTFLNGHLQHFNEEIQGLSSGIVNGALSIHGDIAKTFRKSAINFHYEFNIRHMSNVFSGILMAQPERFSDPAKFVMLWLHETERVYGDRLVSNDDLQKYMGLALSQVKKRFPSYNMMPFFAGENADPLVFCHFADSVQDKAYDRVVSMDKLRGILEEALNEYNEMFVTMNLVLFADAIRHVCRISRIVLNPQGHALLVGVGGSGKQSLSRLSAFVCGYNVIQIVISGTYGIADLKEDIKNMYNKAGIKEEGTMFLFTDSQISNERFLVYINDMLASGNIPDLYTQEEKDEIINNVTPRVKAAGLQVENATCWKYFMDTVRANLHVVLSFSPVTEEFRIRAKRFPALVNSTVIDWFQPWPVEALFSVGRRFLADVDLGSDAVRAGIEKFLPFSFDLVNRTAKTYFKNDRRYVYTTPKSYLELLKLYKDLLQRKRDQMGKGIDRLTNGLQKLRDTAAAVVEIEADLKIKLEDAEQKKTTAEGIAAEVSANKAVVEQETEKAAADAALCAEIQRDVSAVQRSAEEDLAKAEPAVEAAMQALDSLNRKELSECKTMLTPPKGVDDVFGAVVVLLAGIEPNVVVQKNGKVRDKDRNWDASKKALLTNVNAFIDLLKSFKEKADANEVPDINWKEVRPYLEMEHFNVDAISGKNRAAAGLCAWVINIVMYRDIVVTVEPKRQALREANERLDAASKKLAAVRAQVAELQATLDRLTIELNKANAEKAAAIQLVEDGQRRLDLAKRLTTALADENVRWAQGIETMSQERLLLIGDVLIASAFISYIGPFTKKYREELVMKHFLPFLETAAGGDRVPMSATPNPRSILTHEAQIAQWNSEGLPADQVSVENACIVTNTARWPLMIDPQLQGIAWVREKEKANNLVVIRLGQKNMLRTLERAIDTGQPVLIENMGERIDAVLNPVIARSTIKKGHKQYLMLGDKEVEFHKDFRLYLHTKLSNPHYPPEVQAETALVNFTVTELGLEDQLLSMVVQKERPDLALLRNELISQQNQFKIKMKHLEDDILQRLANAEGDITADVELITGLEDTKRISTDIAEKQAVAKQTEIDINITSEKYRPVAARGALIFFLMNELFKVHTYYTYSLSAFVTTFLRAIDLVSGDADPMKAELEALDANGDVEAQEADEAEGGGRESAETELEANGVSPNESKQSTIKQGLTDEQLVRRCAVLKESVTVVSFTYINRGLFERDKLMVATQLTFQVMVRDGRLNGDQVAVLVSGRGDPRPGLMGPLSDWMPEVMWPKVKALEVIPELSKIGDDMQQLSDLWLKWFDEEKPENVPCPGTYKSLSDFHRLLVLRVLRPDRIASALTTFVAKSMGEVFVKPPLFDMEQTYKESDTTTPVFFVLFPGVDPTVWVEGLGRHVRCCLFP
jgi:dynein heavy chain, axonemal